MKRLRTKPVRHEEHIHTPDDGRGHRLVFVNGRQVSRCFYADTKRGIADVYREPLRLDRWRKRALSRRLRGVVVVQPAVAEDRS